MHALQSILLITNNPLADLKSQFDIDGDHPSIDTLVILPDPTIGIESIRQLQVFASRRPLNGPGKYVIIREAQLLTLEAQNALLKVLEEPPSYLTIMLIAPHTHTFLETILSRCRIVRSPQSPTKTAKTNDDVTLKQILSLSPAARLKMIPADTKAKQNAITYCQLLVQEAQTNLHHTPSNTTTNNLEILTLCLNQLLSNANPTLSLTDAILRLQV